MSEPSMVERVARAICVADGFPPDFHSVGNPDGIYWRSYIEHAKDAIAALREPSHAVVVAVERALLAGRHAEAVWAAGIDAALAEGGQDGT